MNVVCIPLTNRRVVFEGREHDEHFLELSDACFWWLEFNAPGWEVITTPYDNWNFSFPTAAQALLFKLTWGGQ